MAAVSRLIELGVGHLGEAKRRVEPIEAVRQRALAQAIGEKLYNGVRLIPTCYFSSFLVQPLVLNLWVDNKISDLAWWAVGKRIQDFVPATHVIDHAWLAGYADPPHEPWALVTEPYDIDDESIDKLKALERKLAFWTIKISIWDKSESAWNPGSTTPIIVTYDHATTFMHKAAIWALKQVE